MEKKLKFFQFFLAVFLLVLWGRLFELQILQGTENRLLADTNRTQKRIIAAPRGLLFDRHGEIIAETEPEYLLAGKKIGRDEALQLQAEKKDSDLTINFKRKYYSGQNFAHVVGFLGEITDSELKDQKMSLRGYSAGDLLGRSGVEEEYEDILRGQKGSQSIEVNTQGQVIRQLAQSPPVPGKSLTLAIDKDLQEVAVKAMDDRKGAVIATNPQNGEVLIFYSSPSFDPNAFLDEKRQTEVAQLMNDNQNQPLLNRVISGLYPPGSTFKIVTSIAGLEEGKITPKTLINDAGVIEVNNFKFANWYFTQYGRTEGQINLVRALTRSTDTFFYKVGEMVGADNLIKWAKRFNLDQTFGIDLPAEVKGFIGSPEWKEKTFGEKWFLGNTYHLAIGQGDLALTPLGVNLMTAAVANGGKICQPRILKIGAENTPYQAECQDLGIKKEFLEVVKEGMLGACASGGTGWPFFDFSPKVACKTGTAETGDGKTSHAWFTVFAPADKPEIVLTVLIEKGGEGSSVAGPVAKEILKAYFNSR